MTDRPDTHCRFDRGGALDAMIAGWAGTLDLRDDYFGRSP
jgi:hypothetical protein